MRMRQLPGRIALISLVTCLALTACAAQQPSPASESEPTGDVEASSSTEAVVPDEQRVGEHVTVTLPEGWEELPRDPADEMELSDDEEAYAYFAPASSSEPGANFVLVALNSPHESPQEVMDGLVSMADKIGHPMVTVDQLPAVEVDGFAVGGWFFEQDYGEFTTEMQQHLYALIPESGLRVQLTFSATPKEFPSYQDDFDLILSSVSLH